MREAAPVSVVVPCWHCGDTIDRAVASIAAQTWLPAEVIVVDDGSGDDTPQRLHVLARRYPPGWVRVIELAQNSGPGTARNAGWERATQTFLAFLDADDAWHPRKVELQYRWMSEHPEVAMSGHGSALSLRGAMAAAPPSDMGSSRVRPWQMLISNRFPTRSVMLRRNLPFRFHTGKDYTEDYLLWLQIILSGEQAWRLEAVLACSFRPEFSFGGYSGNLWLHECRELNALRLIRRDKLVSTTVYALAVVWSLIKYIRRSLLVRISGHRHDRVPETGA